MNYCNYDKCNVIHDLNSMDETDKYNGSDSTLLFCQNHLKSMVALYKSYKSLEQEDGHRCIFGLGRHNHHVWLYHEVSFYEVWLERLNNIIYLRTNFMDKLQNVDVSLGHDHWLSHLKQQRERLIDLLKNN
jgi:hypothetical protein